MVGEFLKADDNTPGRPNRPSYFDYARIVSGDQTLASCDPRNIAGSCSVPLFIYLMLPFNRRDINEAVPSCPTLLDYIEAHLKVSLGTFEGAGVVGVSENWISSQT